MRGILPPEAQDLLLSGNIKQAEAAISDQVEDVLFKLWQGRREQLTQNELNLDITPAELAAVWTITHRRPLRVDTIRQILLRPGKRGEQIKPSRQWGSGPALRRLYRLGDVLEVRVRERAAKSVKSQNSQERA